jgi:hypothetical protein
MSFSRKHVRKWSKSERPQRDKRRAPASASCIRLHGVSASNRQRRWACRSHEKKPSTKKTGLPGEMVSDQARAVKAGVERLCVVHPTSCVLCDMNHKSAVVSKQDLAGEPA